MPSLMNRDFPKPTASAVLPRPLLPYANKSDLEAIGQQFGVNKLQRIDVSSSALDDNFQFYVKRGTFGSINNGQDIVIPAGTQIYTASGLSGQIVVTATPTFWPAAETTALAAVVSMQSGSSRNAAQGVFQGHNFTAIRITTRSFRPAATNKPRARARQRQPAAT